MYLKAHQNGPEAKAGIGVCLRFNNEERPHQALDYQIPTCRDQAFEAGRRPADVIHGKKPATASEPQRRCSPNQEVVSWSWLEPMALARLGLRIMTTSPPGPAGTTAEDSLNLAPLLS